MKFITIPSGSYELGWSFDLPKTLYESIGTQSAIEAFIEMCSIKRVVTLSEFSITTEPIALSDVIGDPYELDEAIEDLASLCQHLDTILALKGLRLATEDELEVSAGGKLFIWGNNIPDGIPYGKQTSFISHHQPNSFGLTFLSDPYKTEICCTALKFGDGGSSICGQDPWPLAWLKLSPCFRMIDKDMVDCFFETLEETYIRPVKLS
jgi:hypothetical protein